MRTYSHVYAHTCLTLTRVHIHTHKHTRAHVLSVHGSPRVSRESCSGPGPLRRRSRDPTWRRRRTEPPTRLRRRRGRCHPGRPTRCTREHGTTRTEVNQCFSEGKFLDDSPKGKKDFYHLRVTPAPSPLHPPPSPTPRRRHEPKPRPPSQRTKRKSGSCRRSRTANVKG